MARREGAGPSGVRVPERPQGWQTGRVPRFLSAKPDARLIPLPWNVPLAKWPTEHLVALPRGISRHVVRFITVGDEVYAAKEVIEHLAIHEYRLLHDLTRLGTPAVEAVAVVSGRQDLEGNPLDSILITKHLEFALPYRSLFTPGVRHETVMRLLDAAKIPYRAAEYEVDENDLNGMHAAEGIGMPPEQIFKTLVAKGERGGYAVFCIPVCCELDLKKAAKAAHDKDIMK